MLVRQFWIDCLPECLFLTAADDTTNFTLFSWKNIYRGSGHPVFEVVGSTPQPILKLQMSKKFEVWRSLADGSECQVGYFDAVGWTKHRVKVAKLFAFLLAVFNKSFLLRFCSEFSQNMCAN